MKLSNTGSTLGTNFRDTFADLFGKFLKKVNLQIEASFRPARALLEMFLICDVCARKRSAGIGSTGQSLEWPITTLRASLPCRVYSILQRVSVGWCAEEWIHQNCPTVWWQVLNKSSKNYKPTENASKTNNSLILTRIPNTFWENTTFQKKWNLSKLKNFWKHKPFQRQMWINSRLHFVWIK